MKTAASMSLTSLALRHPATISLALVAPTLAAVHDPLLDLINAYRAGLADFDANAPEDDDGANAYADVSYSPHLDRLSKWDAPAVTREGAIEALRIASTDNGGCYGCEAADRMVKAALSYFENTSA